MLGLQPITWSEPRLRLRYEGRLAVRVTLYYGNWRVIRPTASDLACSSIEEISLASREKNLLPLALNLKSKYFGEHFAVETNVASARQLGARGRREGIRE